jgi:PadR family transcriptional regulator PadR
MKPKGRRGEFEYLLLTAVMRLGDDAYGAAIRRKIEEATGRCCSIGALYTTLDRLQIKGLIETWMGDSTPQRGGRAKRMVRVTPKGIQDATAFYRAVTRITRDVSWESQRVAIQPWIRFCGVWWISRLACWIPQNAKRCSAT